MVKKLLQSLTQMEERGRLSLRSTMDQGRHIITADLLPMSSTYGVKYALRKEGNYLYCYNFKDCTKDELIISLAAVFPYENGVFDMLYECIFKETDAICTTDMDNELRDAKRLVCAEHESLPFSEKIQAHIDNSFRDNPKSLVYFEAPDNMRGMGTNIYV